MPAMYSSTHLCGGVLLFLIYSNFGFSEEIKKDIIVFIPGQRQVFDNNCSLISSTHTI